MSQDVMLYSSYPLSWKEIEEAIHNAGEGTVEKNRSFLWGSMWKGDQAIFLYGDWDAPDPLTFWEKEMRQNRDGPEIIAKLGAKPRSSLMIELGKVYGSGTLAVELAYQLAVRWPCVVEADTWDPVEGDQFHRIYTREDIEELRRQRKVFTTTVPIMDDEA